MSLGYVVKRSGKRVLFNENKITDAILAAMNDVGKGTQADAKKVTELVVKKVKEKYDEQVPTVEDIQDLVEASLMELRYTDVAKSYILYRNEQARVREQREAIIGTDDVEMSINAARLLEQRYLLRDEKGEVAETPSDMFSRVANTVAIAERHYDEEPKDAARRFYRLLSSLEFLPASPTLMNAATPRQLCPAYAVPVPDNIDGMFKALHEAATIQRDGGGTGFSFSRIRPAGDMAEGMPGVAAGPLKYLKVFEAGMNAVKQSGRREGANMAVLQVDHPDILDFVNLKLTRHLENFNISVGITDSFMQALEDDADYSLINPRTGKEQGTLSARVAFDSILAVSWRTGDPGLVFLDRMNDANPCKIERIETTSPCAEQPLMPYESCPEGSINLTKCLRKREDGWELDTRKLKRICERAVEFLDNIIDINTYPIKQAEEIAKGTRKIGIGIMGFADVLYALMIPYGSEEAEEMASSIITTIRDVAQETSMERAKQRGTFKLYRGSEHEKNNRPLRNSTLLGLAPTGTTSLLADVSSGIEPNYALAYSRSVSGGGEMLFINRFFEHAMKEADVDKEVVQQIAKRGFITPEDDIPDELHKVFVTAQQIAPEWHIRIQAAFQKHVDGAISKTINYPAGASVKDIEEGFLLAWKLGCKGVTVYRDKSLDRQVIRAGG